MLNTLSWCIIEREVNYDYLLSCASYIYYNNMAFLEIEICLYLQQRVNKML